MTEAKKFKVKLHKKQSEAFKALAVKEYLDILYGGAKGGGKSVLGCYWVYIHAWELIHAYDIKPSPYPVPIGFMGRKQNSDFSDTTLETWKTVIDHDLYEYKAHANEIIIDNRVKIVCGGFDRQETINKFNSAEYCFAFIDQAEELTRQDYAMVRSSLRRKIRGNEPNYKLLLTANPADNWLKQEFITQRAEDACFIPALPADNPYLASTYTKNLASSFAHRPELVRAYLHGDWDIMTGHDLIFKAKWLDEAFEKDPDTVEEGPVVVSCDPADDGDCETVIYVFKGYKVIDKMIYGQKEPMETAGYIKSLARKHQAKLIVVDAIGVGSGICSRLDELNDGVEEKNKIPLIRFKGSKNDDLVEQEDKDGFLNLRIKAFWYASELMAMGKVSLPNDLKLRNQLGALKYKTHSEGVLKAEPKKDWITRLGGESVDKADAFTMGLWGFRYVKDESIETFRAPQPRTRQQGYGWNNKNNRQRINFRGSIR